MKETRRNKRTRLGRISLPVAAACLGLVLCGPAYGQVQFVDTGSLAANINASFNGPVSAPHPDDNKDFTSVPFTGDASVNINFTEGDLSAIAQAMGQATISTLPGTNQISQISFNSMTSVDASMTSLTRSQSNLGIRRIVVADPINVRISGMVTISETGDISPSANTVQTFVFFRYVDGVVVEQLVKRVESTMMLDNEIVSLSPGEYFVNVVNRSEVIGTGTANLTTTDLILNFLQGGVWNNAAGGVFGESGNWQAGIVPDASTMDHSGYFDLPDTYTVSFNANRSIRNATVSNGAVTFDLNGNTHSLSGDLSINGGANDASLTIADGAVDVDSNGDGRVTVGGGEGMTTLTLDATDVGLAARTNRLRTHKLEIRKNGHMTVGDEVVVGDQALSPFVPESNIAVIARHALSLSDGGKLTTARLLLSGSSTANSMVTVDGEGTNIEITGDLTTRGLNPLLHVGALGAGMLRILNGAHIGEAETPLLISVGTFGNNIGLLEISGSSSGGPSTLTANGLFTIGQEGTGSIEVSNGGLLEAGLATQMILGEMAGGSGLVRISGTGSKLEASQNLSVVIGDEGTGNLEVLDGATADVGNLVFGNNSGSMGHGRVSGEGSMLSVGMITVGNEGNGSVLVEDGGVLALNLLGQVPTEIGASTGTGRLDITSSAKVTSGHFIQVGTNGTIGIDHGALETEGVKLAGLIQMTEGTLTVTAAVTEEEAAFDVQGGRVCGTGVIQLLGIGATLNVQDGALCPGNSPGTLTIDGNYNQSPAGTLEIEFAGITPGTQHDVLHVTGDATIGGTLLFSFIDGFAPQAGNLFEFLVVEGDFNGDFDDVQVLGLEPGFEFDVNFDNGMLSMLALNDGVVPETTTASLVLTMLLYRLARSRKRPRDGSRSIR